MEHLLFACYLILFAWLVTKVNFFKASGLTPAQLVIFFLLKVMAGIFYGWIGVYYGEMAQMVDTWYYHYESLKEITHFKKEPVSYFLSLFHSGYDNKYGGFLYENSWWNDIKGNILIKLLTVFNFLSAGNYYTNIIFYSFLTFFGPIAVFRIMNSVFPNRKMLILLGCFLIPSFLYWTSGIHKDGFIFEGIALAAYHIYFGLKEKRFSILRILIITFSLLLVLALRNFLIITLLPALLAWILAEKLPARPILVFTGIYTLFIILFFTLKYIHPTLDFPQAVADKQEAFMKLHGGSAVDVKPLQPTVTGFMQNAWEAFTISTIRPYPSDVRHLLSLAAAVEVSILLLLFIVFLIWRRRDTSLNPFLLFCLFLSFSMLMMIGFSVNFLGAIVRYRSIILPFLIVPMLAQTDWSKIYNRIFYSTKKNTI